LETTETTELTALSHTFKLVLRRKGKGKGGEGQGGRRREDREGGTGPLIG